MNQLLRHYFLLSVSILFLIFPGELLYSQSTNTGEETAVNEISQDDSTESDILLYPDELPEPAYTGYWTGEQRYLYTGLNYNSGGMGVELHLIPRNSSGFFSISLSAIAPEQTGSIQTGLMAEFSYAYRRLIHSFGEQTHKRSPEVYVNVGPGFSTVGVSEFGNSERERLIGFNAWSSLGLSLQIAERSRLNLEAGWKRTWFPGSEDLNFIGGLQFTLGFSFSGSGGF